METRRTARRLTLAMTGIALALSLAGCSVAATQPPTHEAGLQSTPAATSTQTPSVPSSPTPTATTTASTVSTPSATPTPSSRSSASPSSTLGSLPVVASAAKGTWTSITWISIPSGHAPKVPTDGTNPASSFNLTSWSGGFLDLIWNAHTRTLVPWTSADGIRWTAQRPMDTSAWKDRFANWDKQATTAEEHDMCGVWLTGFYEGANSLLLRAETSCGGGCGWSVADATTGLWTSSDGVSWTPLDENKAFGAMQVSFISASSGGFIASGTQGGKPAMRVSPDGRNWIAASFPAEALAPMSKVDTAASIAAGYVLPGTVLTKSGDIDPPLSGTGCAYALNPLAHPALFVGALWLSRDGRTWTRDDLPGADEAARVSMSVTQIDDTTIVAREDASTADESATQSTQFWVSRDGRTWKPIPSDSFYVAASGRNAGLMGIADSGLMRYFTFDDQLNRVEVTQSGDVRPPDGVNLYMGPTGLLATPDGVQFWLGVPTVR